MEKTLTFNEVSLTPIQHNQQVWIRSAELSRALGYSSEKSVSNIYNRNQDEFSNDMSVVIDLSTTDIPALSRIFSLRGCHLLAMFARTPVAKDFRRWVLDVLDKLAEDRQPTDEPRALPPVDAPLTPDQQCTLQSIVKAKVEGIPEADRPKGLYPKIWSRFNNHFRLGSYKQLPQCRLSDAIEYLMHMDIKPKALPPAEQPKAATLLDPLSAPAEVFVPYPEYVDMRTALKARVERLKREVSLTRGLFRHILTGEEDYGVQEALYSMMDANLAAAWNALDAGARICPTGR